MAEAESGSLPSEEEVATFLQATKPTELRTASLTALRQLLQELTDACEASRTDALRHMANRAQDGQISEVSEHNQSFADLFAALRRVRAELKRRTEEGDVERHPMENATRSPARVDTENLRQIPTTAPDVYAFRIRATLSADDLTAMAETMNAAFDAWDTVSMLLILAEFEGRETGAGFDLETMKSQFRSLRHVEKYAVVGPPTYARRLIKVMDKVMPVDARTFDAAEEHRAWEFVGARALSESAD